MNKNNLSQREYQVFKKSNYFTFTAFCFMVLTNRKPRYVHFKNEDYGTII